MKKAKKHTFGHLLRIAGIIDEALFSESLSKLPRPKRLCGKEVPETLNEMTYGTLCELGTLPAKPMEAVFSICKILLGIEKKEVLKAYADDVLGFFVFVGNEIKRINKLFEDISIPPTNEQRQAGIESLNFGVFGTIDWYARRMGIKNHDEVLPVKWVRIYQCLKIDNSMELYNRRLNNVYSNKNKIR